MEPAESSSLGCVAQAAGNEVIMTVQGPVVAAAAPKIHWLNTTYQVVVAAAQAGRAMGSFFAEVQPGEGPPLHLHRGEDEAIHVVDGAADFWLDGAVTRLVAGQGVFLPRGLPHTFRVVSERPGRMLGVVTPGGFEGFFAAAAEAGVGPHDRAALAAFGADWKLEFLGPSPLMR